VESVGATLIREKALLAAREKAPTISSNIEERVDLFAQRDVLIVELVL